MDISTVLTIIACVCFFLAAFGIGWPRMAMGWLGLALWCLASLVTGFVESK